MFVSGGESSSNVAGASRDRLHPASQTPGRRQCFGKVSRRLDYCTYAVRTPVHDAGSNGAMRHASDDAFVSRETE